MTATAQITGHTAADLELRFTPTGTPVATGRIAVNHRTKDQQTGEWITKATSWFRISWFGADAERAAELIRKGQRITVVGDLEIREWESNSGSKGTSAEITSRAWSIVPQRDKQPPAPADYGAPF